MAGGLGKPATTIAGIDGLCVSVAFGVGLGAYTVTGVDPLYASPSMATVPYAGAERDNVVAAKDAPAIIASNGAQGPRWVGEQDGRGDGGAF
ncbi:MAG: hypothetical protein ABIS14_02550 [Sphingomonas sp.]